MSHSKATSLFQLKGSSITDGLRQLTYTIARHIR